MNRTRKLVATLLLLFGPALAEGAVTTSVVDVPTRAGVSERILHITPDAPVAHVVALIGDTGFLGIQSDGTVADIALNDTIERNGRRWGAQGIALTVVDVPSDRTALDTGFRKTPEHVADILAVAHYLRQRAAVPVWLWGLSHGNVSVVQVATSPSLDVPLGLVLGNPRTIGPAGLYETDLASIRQPTLLINAVGDMCATTPELIAGVIPALVNAPVKEHVPMVGGVTTQGDPCEDVGPHGLEGLDTILVGVIGGWISQYNALIGGTASPVALAVEFYHAAFDHYFISSSLPDIIALGTGRLTGWKPTLEDLPVVIAHKADTQPVCRFYIPPAFGDSHFYSASVAECMETAAKFPQLELESPNVFEIGLPDPATGTCPAGTAAVYRIWNGRADSNHRYTLRTSIRDQMVALGGVVEGYGTPPVAMCSPI
jgi:hypothetical protein